MKISQTLSIISLNVSEFKICLWIQAQTETVHLFQTFIHKISQRLVYDWQNLLV